MFARSVRFGTPLGDVNPIRFLRIGFSASVAALSAPDPDRDSSYLRAHLPIEVLGVENVIVQIGDPLAA
jgi:hypothetical protein